jgi:predicted nucleic acid-binding protein
MLSQPGYPNPVPASQATERLAEATRHLSHAFWRDSISLLEPAHLTRERILSSRQVMDAYLLAFAVRQGGRFVTLDCGISMEGVGGASTGHLVVIS